MDAESYRNVIINLKELIKDSIGTADSYIESYNTADSHSLKSLNALKSTLINERNKLLRISDNIGRMKEVSGQMGKNNENRTVSLCEWLRSYNNESNYKHYLNESRRKLTRCRVALAEHSGVDSKEEEKLQKLKLINTELMTVKMNMKYHKISLEMKEKHEIEQGLDYSSKEPLPYYPVCIESARLLPNFKQLAVYKHNNDPVLSYEFTVTLSSTLPSNCATALTARQIFVSGGCSQFFNTPAIHSHTFALTSSGRLTALKDMLHKRHSHGLVALNDKCLHAVGGCGDEGCMKSCEVYLIEEDEWKESEGLNMRRCCVGLCQFEQRVVYAFYGFKTVEMCSIECSIEKLDTTAVNPKWNIVNVNPLKGIVNFGMGQISDKEILLFGGSSFVYKVPKKNCYIFNTETKSLTKGEMKMACPDEFVGTHSIYNGKALIALGRSDCVHYFDVQSKAWNKTPFRTKQM
eukprot:TRINITY_DN4441_c0_g1_i1.p1 TRINITY_DN4441_c0_g1~~TRINITY_DN4441_c0_g1_i1.p1  ORF type:complete len:463 (+),score=78.38 TRINITY_DN4441_c0_g1_i1:162-1550(+)